jgi:hypothetical protein
MSIILSVKEGVKLLNTFLSHVINKITTNIKGVKAIVLSGSQQTESIVDLWSDTDLLVILDPGFSTDEQQFIQIIKEFGFVVGSELHKPSEQSIMYRTAIEFECSVQLLDVQICSYTDWILIESKKNQSYTIVYGQIDIDERTEETVEDYSFDSYESNSTWFKYFIAIKKFARKDNLVGMHLLMDLIKEYLVVEMIERDIKHRTNIHRFGYEEQLPDTVKLSYVDGSDKVQIFDYIKRLAYEYDKKLMSNIKGYISKYPQIADFIEKSKQFYMGN